MISVARLPQDRHVGSLHSLMAIARTAHEGVKVGLGRLAVHRQVERHTRRTALSVLGTSVRAGRAMKLLLKARGVREVDNHIRGSNPNTGALALDALPKSGADERIVGKRAGGGGLKLCIAGTGIHLQRDEER